MLRALMRNTGSKPATNPFSHYRKLGIHLSMDVLNLVVLCCAHAIFLFNKSHVLNQLHEHRSEIAHASGMTFCDK